MGCCQSGFDSAYGAEEIGVDRCQGFKMVPIVPRQTEVTLDDSFLRSVRDVVMRTCELLNTERHIHVPFLTHRWVGIRCCVVLCAERNNRGVNGFFTNKGGGMLEP